MAVFDSAVGRMVFRAVLSGAVAGLGVWAAAGDPFSKAAMLAALTACVSTAGEVLGPWSPNVGVKWASADE